MKSMKKAAKKSTMKRRKAMKVSKIARGKRAKSSVFRGTKEKTGSGLKKGDLMKNKYGKVVTKKSHARGQKKQVGPGLLQGPQGPRHQGILPLRRKNPQGKSAPRQGPLLLQEINM